MHSPAISSPSKTFIGVLVGLALTRSPIGYGIFRSTLRAKSVMAGILRKGLFLVTGYRNFTQNGYNQASKHFDNSVMAKDLKGKVCVVTGANTGIGFQAAKEFAERGSKVIMVCRNPERGAAAVKQVQEVTGNADVHLSVCDVSSLASVKAFVEDFKSSGSPLHVLVNNAGVMVHDKNAKSAEGYDINFATNTLGTFALTILLEDVLKKSAPSKVIMVSSGGMLIEKLETANLQNEDLRAYDGITAYSRDKRRQVALGEKFAKEWGPSGVGVYSMHPGWVDTPGLQTSMESFHSSMKSSMRTLEQGTDTIVWLGLQDQDKLEPGGFFLDRTPQAKHLPWGGTQYSEKDVDSLWTTLMSMVNKS